MFYDSHKNRGISNEYTSNFKAKLGDCPLEDDIFELSQTKQKLGRHNPLQQQPLTNFSHILQATKM